MEKDKGLLKAAKIGAKWMKSWLDEDICECEYRHHCGRTEREKELEFIKTEIAKHPANEKDKYYESFRTL